MGIFGMEKKNVFEGIDSVVGGKAKFKGEIISSGSVNINGEFEGRINSEGEVILSPGSKLTGNINGGTVIISGKVDGNIIATGTLEITKSGRVHGDLVGGRIIIEEGSSYHGKVKVHSAEEEPEAVAQKLAAEEVIEESPEPNANSSWAAPEPEAESAAEELSTSRIFEVPKW